MTSEGVASLAKQVGLRVSDDGALWGNAQALESFARQTIDPYQAEVHLLRAQRDALLEAYRKMKNVAAGYSGLCDDSASTSKLEREFEAADAIARAAIKAVEENT